MKRLWRFGNAVVDLEKVWAVSGDMAMMEGGHWCTIGEAACKAIVGAMPFYRAAEARRDAAPPEGAAAGRTETPRQDEDNHQTTKQGTDA